MSASGTEQEVLTHSNLSDYLIVRNDKLSGETVTRIRKHCDIE